MLWGLGIFVAWLSLAILEGLIIDRLDKNIRADREVFLAYIDGLPAVLDGTNKGWLFHCSEPRVGVLWRYRICLREVNTSKSEPSTGCRPPFYKVSYDPPAPSLTPDLNEALFTPFRLHRDKSVCDERDISEY